MKDEYIVKQDAVREALEKKSKLLVLHLQQQLDELQLVKQSKEELMTTAHTLADKYEDAVETQRSLTQRFFFFRHSCFDCTDGLIPRIETILYEIQKRSPVLTDAEKQMTQQLRLLDNKLHTMRQSIESLKRREQLYGNKVLKQPQPFSVCSFVHVFKVTLSQSMGFGGNLTEEQRTSVNEALAIQ